MCVLGADPGRDKCGIAVLNSAGEIKFQKVIETEKFSEIVSKLAKDFKIEIAILGNGTTHQSAAEKIKSIGLPLKIVDEKHTTEEARKLYWVKNPPKGWRKILPTTMLVPPKPVDDLVAEILARRYLESEKSGGNLS